MSWITSIAQGIEKAFSGIRPALKMIPPLLLICELYRRPGLSAIALTSAIIRRLPEAGIETGVNADGSPNKINGFVRIISEEIVKEFKDNARVTSVIEPGIIMSIGTGSNSGGPVVVTSTNSMITRTLGLIE
jgi:hypothetical protein